MVMTPSVLYTNTYSKQISHSLCCRSTVKYVQVSSALCCTHTVNTYHILCFVAPVIYSPQRLYIIGCTPNVINEYHKVFLRYKMLPLCVETKLWIFITYFVMFYTYYCLVLSVQCIWYILIMALIWDCTVCSLVVNSFDCIHVLKVQLCFSVE